MTRHDDEVRAERGYCQWVYELFDQKCARYEAGPQAGVAGPGDARALANHYKAKRRELASAEDAIMIGRLDCDDGTTWYLGKTHLEGDGVNPDGVALVDWRAPVGEAFFQADRSERMGVGRRRTFRMRGRQLLDLADDVLDPSFRPKDVAMQVLVPPKSSRRAPLASPSAPRHPAPATEPGDRWSQREEDRGLDLRAGRFLEEALGEARTGAMREALATLQAEQDRQIRAARDRILVIQGGPGSGKTLVAMHRAAWILYQQREKGEEPSVLVVGPNRAFLSYVEGVLPSLGESTAAQTTIDDLALAGLSVTQRRRFRKIAEEDPQVAKLKGRREWLAIVSDAVWSRAQPRDVFVRFHGGDFVARSSSVSRILDQLKASVTYGDAPERFRRAIYVGILGHYEKKVPASQRPTGYQQGLDAAVRGALKDLTSAEGILPSDTAAGVVQRLWTDPEHLEAVAGRRLTAAQRRRLHRAAPTRGEAWWTHADLPLVAAAERQLGGRPVRYGHVIVDEAQDLSPLQWDLVSMRAARDSLTFVGDVAQTTAAAGVSNWASRLVEMGQDGSVVELTIGYRIPSGIAEVAANLLPSVAPGLRVPTPVREGGRPEVVQVSTSTRFARLVELLQTPTSGSRGVLVPRSLLEKVTEALRGGGVAFQSLTDEGYSTGTTVLAAIDSKGLEFDDVIVFEPAVLAAGKPHGIRELFVAVSRATKSLTLVTSRALPPALGLPVSPSAETGSPPQARRTSGSASTTARGNSRGRSEKQPKSTPSRKPASSGRHYGGSNPDYMNCGACGHPIQPSGKCGCV